MQSLTKNKELLSLLKESYKDLTFKEGPRFLFRPKKTIIYNLSDENFPLLILHELGHALLERYDFKTDIERLKIETLAWEKAKELSKEFDVKIDEDFIESKLDTYRDWLHQKTRCKKCSLTRFQTPNGAYHCPKCDIL